MTMDPKSTNNGFLKRTVANVRPNHITLNGFGERKKPKLGNSPMKQNHCDYAALEAQKKALPIYNARLKLVTKIQKLETLIIIGETGCGKTTQIPQYIYEENLNNSGVIGVTQPRRVAATTLSTRVALEAKTILGDLVGYCIRFEDVTSAQTRIKYLTDGMLLREAILDTRLLAYNVIILDEAHERTVSTDALFGIVKKAQATRKRERLKPLKVIVMSATMDVDHFSNYFDSAPVIYLEGRQHPVQIFHALQPQEDYIFSTVVTVFQLHREAPPNEDILVFLTGQEEIESVAYNIRSVAKELGGTAPPLKVFPMYSALQTSQLQSAFRPTVQGQRKVILSTNIAETSVTIPGIKYVIDSGKVKAKVHQPGSGLDLLKVKAISQAQAWQRTGRAGRESSGSCYRVYTQEEFSSMVQHTQPEILRSNLSTVALQLLAMNINVATFDFIDKPSKESVQSALKQLKILGAIDSIESPVLTSLGHKMAKFPIDPRYSKILLSAQDFDCGEDILNIIAVLSVDSIFMNVAAKRDEAREAHKKFVNSAGDHVTILQVFRTFKKISNQHNWCHENFLNSRNLQYALNVRKQLAEICKGMDMTLTCCGQDFDKVRRCLITGLFMNVAELQRDKQYFTVVGRQKVSIHPSSVLAGTLPACVLFSELVQTSKNFIRNLSVVDPDWLTELVPEFFRQNRLSGFPSQST